MLGSPVTIAFGAILSEYYGKDIKDCDLIVRSRGKNGTNDFLGRLAAQGIGPASKAFLGARHLKPGADAAGLIGQMIGDIRRLGISPALALPGRGPAS